MSEYPRSPEAAPPKPYLPDRIVAGLYAAALIVSKAVIYGDSSHRLDLLIQFQEWLPYLYATDALLSLTVVWILFGLGRSRRWGFVAALVVGGMVLAMCVANESFPIVALVTPLWIYVVARLSRRFGPRPLRRHEAR